MSIYKKLFEAKKEIGKITKDAKNPFFKSNYLSLNGLIDAVEPILSKHGLLLLQPIEEGRVTTRIIEIIEGDVTESSMQLPNIQDPQKLGSAITYFRRYTLQSLLGLQAEDDDGNSATKQVKIERKPSITIEQYDKAKGFNKEQLNKVINGYRMTTAQREGLIKLKELCK